ncbi:GxxExxY protein [Rhodovibrio salinarum]|uniref:GxxExxY protein n=1 Tax=Rhodovibrio salinarum TaxID=1087 RepID=A0A934QMB0_9PROT|nr:GxxExxY protein [Rhodovibrio salinarum]MBK1699198.1 GxxExxY protein [Rhodovibrio salinarum]
MEPIPAETDQLARACVDSALKVHRALGPGLLEQVYERCLVYELGQRCIECARQFTVPIYYDGVKLDSDLRIDLLVSNQLVVEIKAVEAVLPVHRAQLLTYLKLTGHRLGLLINFNVPVIKDGIHRIAL